MISRCYESVVKPVVRYATPASVWSGYGNALWYRKIGYPVDVNSAKTIGWPATLKLRLLSAATDCNPIPRSVRIKGFPHPLYFRRGSSDPDVIRQVFVAREYACVLGESDVRFILDCGANVGYTTLFLLHHYPNAQAIVVEPDPANMAMCRKNLAPFAGRVTFFSSGVWSSSVPLVVERGNYADGREWAIQVRPARTGEQASLTAMTISDLMKNGNFPRIDILKMDIEAAEVDVFTGPLGWLDVTRTLVIELHGPECEAVVHNSIADRLSFETVSGELSVFRRPSNVADEGGP